VIVGISRGGPHPAYVTSDEYPPAPRIAEVVIRCARCSFVIVVQSLQEAHAAFHAHACDPPKPTSTLERGRGYPLI
jgi:hypothetical protein